MCKVLFVTQIFRDTSLSTLFVNKKIVVLLNVSLNYISCLDCLSRYRSLPYRFACCNFQSSSHAGVLKMPHVSNEYGVLEAKCERK